MVSSQAGAHCFNVDKRTPDDFDVSDKAFSAIFENIQPCRYSNANSFPTKTTGTKDGLLLLHLNIRSLAKNYDSLVAFLSTLAFQSHIIALTETKIRDKPTINIAIPGFTFLHVNSKSNAGRVGVYVSDLLQYKQLTFSSTFSVAKLFGWKLLVL